MTEQNEAEENPEIEVENPPEELPNPDDQRDNAQRHWRNLPTWQKEDPWFKVILASLENTPLPAPYRNNLIAQLTLKEMAQ